MDMSCWHLSSKTYSTYWRIFQRILRDVSDYRVIHAHSHRRMWTCNLHYTPGYMFVTSLVKCINNHTTTISWSVASAPSSANIDHHASLNHRWHHIVSSIRWSITVSGCVLLLMINTSEQNYSYPRKNRNEPSLEAIALNVKKSQAENVVKELVDMIDREK